MRCIDLFAGAGGLSLGFEQAGFEVCAAFDNWEPAVLNYQANFDHPIFDIDLSDTEEVAGLIAKYNADVIMGGPPCQDFSHAGKRVEEDRANLTAVFAEIISLVKPPYFVMENVDRAAKSYTYKRARGVFKSSGYGITEIVLDASHFGVPQKRKRFFCVGIHGAADRALEDYINQLRSDSAMTVREYLGDEIDIEYYYRHPRNYSRRAVFSIDESSPTIRGVNRPVAAGYPGHPGDAIIINDEIRPLTGYERSRIQTFPSWFRWVGTKTSVEQMIGNAVPVNLAACVASALLHYIKESTQQTSGGGATTFEQWISDHMKVKERSRRDIVSRFKRGIRLAGVSESRPADEIILHLNRNPEFKLLSTSVKSQIQRAIVLHDQYLSEVDSRCGS